MSEETPKTTAEGQGSESQVSASESSESTPQEGQVETGTTQAAETQENPEQKASVEATIQETRNHPDNAKFDPAKLPEELQPVYKSMQADFTKKWQSVAGAKKYTDLGKKVAELSKKDPDALLAEVDYIATQGQPAANVPVTPQVDPVSLRSAPPEVIERLQQLEQDRQVEKDKSALRHLLDSKPELKPFEKQLWALGMKDPREYDVLASEFISPILNAGKESAARGIDKAERSKLLGADGSGKTTGTPDYSKMSATELEKVLPHANSDEGYKN